MIRWNNITLAVAVLACPLSSAREISFNLHVRPLLSDRCFTCHGPDEHERKASLRLDQSGGPEGAYRNHEGVTAVKPGSLEESELWHRITSTDQDEIMPPSDAHKKPLSKAEQDIIRQWILAGAPYERFWAFVPPENPAVPETLNRDWSKQVIDLHVLHELEQQQLEPSPEADRRTLIRRLTFDLTGLPPTRAEIHSFLGDKSPNAYEKLVDLLFSREQYGEHMARYWLDLVRFADTNGMHKDFYRNNIAYRDWVIRAFNENLSYDDFLRYQLAGDLYDNPDSDQLAASGFHRLHLIIDSGTALPEESFFKNVTDRVTAVGTAFMGLTVQCATCHDHKYDPLTQKDFYSLFAFFNNIDAKPETSRGEQGGLQPPFRQLGTAEEQAELKDLDAKLALLNPRVEEAKKIALAEKDPEKKKPLMQAARELVAQKNPLARRRAQLDKTMVKAMVMKERGQIRETHIMKRGRYDDPGEKVTRDTPAFLPPLRKQGATASRMDLAEWFVSRENPLTARVAVNRLWQQLFGVGLVRTSEDLGAQGEVPSHPELLDHLSVAFIDSGWDIKAMMKAMVMSRAYRQSSTADPGEFKKDPENRLLSRGSRYRMDAEMIRDQILATSGLLSKTMYGKSVKPPQPDGLWKAVTMIGERFKADSGESIYRRSVYTYWKRGMPPPQMTILNAPIRDACVARRERTNTPSQALLLLNEGEYFKAARNLARQVILREGPRPDDPLTEIYETITSRLPDPGERALLSLLVKDLEKSYLENPQLAEKLCAGESLQDAGKRARLAAWTVLVNTLYNLDITKTRQ